MQKKKKIKKCVDFGNRYTIRNTMLLIIYILSTLYPSIIKSFDIASLSFALLIKKISIFSNQISLGKICSLHFLSKACLYIINIQSF